MAYPVSTHRVQDHTLVGVLCVPDGAVHAPGVLLIGGSEGGLHERDAQVLASEGFTVLALAYFGAPGLPAGLIEIPLEYFFQGLDHLGAQPGAGDRFAVLGGSRGGEGALLIGAHDPRVAAVVSVVGSGIVTAGIDYPRGTLLDIVSTQTVSWTLDDDPLPFLPYVIPDELRDLVDNGRPVPLTLVFPTPPADPTELERVSIPVERIRGAVLLISGRDDAMWPSPAYSQIAADRLAAAGHPYTFEHRILRAGHPLAGPPGDPLTTTQSPGPGVTFEMGGTPAANTQARADAWKMTVDFLADNLC